MPGLPHSTGEMTARQNTNNYVRCPKIMIIIAWLWALPSANGAGLQDHPPPTRIFTVDTRHWRQPFQQESNSLSTIPVGVNIRLLSAVTRSTSGQEAASV